VRLLGLFWSHGKSERILRHYWDLFWSPCLEETNLRLLGLFVFGLLANLSVFWDTIEISSEALVERRQKWDYWAFLFLVSWQIWAYFETLLRFLWSSRGDKFEIIGPLCFWSHGKSEHILRHYWDFFWSSREDKCEIIGPFCFLVSWQIWVRFETLLRFLLKL